METGTDGDRFSFVMAYFILILFCILPVVILLEVCSSYEQLDLLKTRKKIGLFYPDVDI